ncbi:threonine ammonia-lyase [Aurantiacibacter gangjinensis]|uniref:Pyridoxal-5'-phosphate-dependent protein n=1 Tax=Aurantiacibacter gangjinensis TaxID=502682 RepID=A0A0G9MUT6_9SPHN|nr:threonine/serine dehydratase [Aurantiacibacter gangjinensis]APE28965.1 Threonine dehydratase, catabolic [Aurantiacibacter gangjinensis]KLE33083.1 pyridoxal-5'-phosphate-dependent protein [Aurantiacibacter gangjinensis]
MSKTTQRNPTREGVLAAARKIAAILSPTPLLPFEVQGKTAWAKAESLQPMGAFKIRGAWHRLSDLSEAEKANGVVAVSSGNHAQGVAWAARKLGIAATIVMPEDAPQVKLQRTRSYGAKVITYDRMSENREAIATSLAEELGATYVHAFGDPWVIEGQGTAGIEIADQMLALTDKPVSRIVACCGGGGLTAGLALACPDADIIPVEPEGWDDICRSLETGEIQNVGDNPPPTACDALQTFATQPINFAVLKERCHEWARVSEDEIRQAQDFAFSNLRLVTEPGGAAALAAVLTGKVEVDDATAVLITGGNMDIARWSELIRDIR